MATVEKPVEHVRQPGQGETIRALAGALTFKVRAEQSNGALTVWETAAPPGEGPPLHVHANEDEALYTLDGTLRFRLEDEIRTAPAGSFVFIPRGTPHTWQNIGDAPARLLVIFTPAAAGVERFFERFAELPEDEKGLEAFGRLASEADTEVVGPPLADSHPLPQRAGAPEGPHADRISSEDDGASNDLEVTIAAVRQGLSAFIQGDPMPQRPLWSKRDDVTLANPFGPPRRGWSDVEETIERAAAEFSDGTVSFEEVSRVVTADLAYLVQIERFSAKIGGRDEPSSGSLRVTMIFRRESDGWRIAHRHADTITTPRPAESVIHGR